MKNYIITISSLMGVLMLMDDAYAQDIQFGDPKQVIQFYNQAIVEEGSATARLNFRDIKVQKLNAFKSGGRCYYNSSYKAKRN